MELRSFMGTLQRENFCDPMDCRDIAQLCIRPRPSAGLAASLSVARELASTRKIVDLDGYWPIAVCPVMAAETSKLTLGYMLEPSCDAISESRDFGRRKSATGDFRD